MNSTRFSKWIVVALVAIMVLAACQPVAEEITDTELNVLCTPQEAVVPGHEAGI